MPEEEAVWVGVKDGVEVRVSEEEGVMEEVEEEDGVTEGVDVGDGSPMSSQHEAAPFQQPQSFIAVPPVAQFSLFGPFGSAPPQYT